jgi:hypothetical protein
MASVNSGGTRYESQRTSKRTISWGPNPSRALRTSQRAAVVFAPYPHSSGKVPSSS